MGFHGQKIGEPCLFVIEIRDTGCWINLSPWRSLQQVRQSARRAWHELDKGTGTFIVDISSVPGWNRPSGLGAGW